MRAKAKKKNQCMMPGCTGEKHIRGVCRRCYQATQRLVREGRADWVKLENEGFAEAPAPRGQTTPAYDAIVAKVEK